MFLPGSWAPCDWCQPAAPATPSCEADEADDEPEGSTITLDGEKFEIQAVHCYGDYSEICTDGGDFYVFRDHESAGKAAREHYADMAANDPAEFQCIMGAETLIAWGMGQYAGPGSRQVQSLSEWLDLWLQTPEEHFASYDGAERIVDDCSDDACDEIEFCPEIAYRCN